MTVPPACPGPYLKRRASQPPGPSQEAPDGPESEHLWGRLRSAFRQLLTSSVEAPRAGTRGPSAWLRQTTRETVRDGGRGPGFHSSCSRWGRTRHVPEGPGRHHNPQAHGEGRRLAGWQPSSQRGGSLSGPTDCWAAKGTLSDHRTETTLGEAEARGPQGDGDHSPRRGRPGRPSPRPRKGARPRLHHEHGF